MLEYGKSKRSAMWLTGRNENYKFCWYSIHIISCHGSSHLSFWVLLLTRTLLCLSLLHPILSYPILFFFTRLRTPPVFFNLSHKVKSNYQISSALTITILTYIIYSQNVYTFLTWACLFLQLGITKKVEIHFLMHHHIWMLGSLFLLYKA